MPASASIFSNPKSIADAGERIYQELKTQLESEHAGQFIAINVASAQYQVGDSPEEALEAAKAADPKGLFHLIRVGFPGAFQISYAIRAPGPDWLFG